VTVGGLPGGTPPNGTYNAGRFSLTTNPASAGPILSWCVDVFNFLATPRTYQVVNFENPTVTNGNGASVLSLEQVDQVTGLALAGNAQLDSAGPNTWIFAPYTDTEVSAAVQAAIWKVINPTASVTSSNSRVSALLGLLLNPTNLSYIQGEGAQVAVGGAKWLYTVNGQGQFNGQGQITLPGGGGGFEVPVPAPAAAFIFALGLVGLAAVRRRA
jgi:hypothetical protein